MLNARAALKAIDDEGKESCSAMARTLPTTISSRCSQTYQQLAEKVYGVVQAYAKENRFGVVLDASASQQQLPTVLWATDGAGYHQGCDRCLQREIGRSGSGT